MPACDFRDLKRASQIVTCPGCNGVEQTIRVRQGFSSGSTFFIIYSSLFTLGFALVHFLSKGPGGEWLTHYCGQCGLRLLFYERHGGRYPFIDAQLVDSLPARQKGGVTRVALSPYPVDKDLVAHTNFTSWKERYRDVQPSIVYWIDSDPATSMPTAAWDETRTEKCYMVTYPDFDRKGKFKAEFFWGEERAGGKFVETVWKSSNANMRVDSTRNNDKHGSTVGMAQIAQVAWDVTLYFPKQAAKAPDQYDMRKHRILDKEQFRLDLPYFLWESSQGHLLWTARVVTDAREVIFPRCKKRLVLLDSYDRLVAMEYQPVPKTSDLAEIWEVSQQVTGIIHTRKQLRLYGHISEKMAAEIMTSYVALYAQLCRRWDYDQVFLQD